MKPQGIAFDLDETLTPSKQPMTPEMADSVCCLTKIMPIAIVSGATHERFLKQVVQYLDSAILPRVTLYPTCGAASYIYKNGFWIPLYERKISAEEASRITSILENTAAEIGLLDNTKVWGPRTEWRGSQVTLSALGQDAPYEEKFGWDKDKKKRLHLRELLLPQLPEYDIALGGTTSVDIVEKGIDKAHAVNKFAEQLKVPVENIMYVGDDLAPGGNDYVVAEKTTAMTRSVRSPSDTLELIQELLKD